MFDAYTLRARIMPAGMVLLPPLTFAGGAFIAEPIDTASPLGMVLFVGAAIGAVIARARGRRLQPKLWLMWGGSPTVQGMRWRSSSDLPRTRRLHARVQQLVDVPLPTPEEETRDPFEADERYEEAAGELRELTRGADYPLVADANADYGFRRNLLGVKPVGLVVAISTMIASAILLIQTGELLLLIPLGVGLIATVLWALVREQWVRTAADDYARHLLGATKHLVGGAPAP